MSQNQETPRNDEKLNKMHKKEEDNIKSKASCISHCVHHLM